MEQNNSVHPPENKKSANPDRREVKKFDVLDKASVTRGIVGRVMNQSDDEYREQRMCYLEAYVQRIKLENANDKSVIGIAVSDQYPEDSSEDIVLIDSDNWDDDYKAEAEETVKIFRQTGMWKSKRELYHYTDYEYPLESPKIKVYKGGDRNRPCPCGSGKKLKKCCLQNIDQ